MYVDSECRSMMIFAENLDAEQIAPVWPRIRRGIMERIQMCEYGRLHAPQWFEKRLHEIDPLLSLRWDFMEQCFVVDRWTRSERCWHTVLVWKDENGPKHLDNSLIQTLHDGDTWRFKDWKEYLRYKHAQSAKKRAANRQASEDKMGAVIDNMSNSQIHNFMEVERALMTGETVVCHGATEKGFEHMHQGAMKAAEKGEMVGPPNAKVVRPRIFNKGVK